MPLGLVSQLWRHSIRGSFRPLIVRPYLQFIKRLGQIVARGRDSVVVGTHIISAHLFEQIFSDIALVIDADFAREVRNVSIGPLLLL